MFSIPFTAVSHPWAFERFRCCIDGHDCGDSQTADLPTRLLDLDTPDPNQIKLVLTTNISPCVQYAALSYCWGKNNSNTLKTTPSNLQQHLKAIRFSDLPRTLREAIWVARDLGIRYLWIDALCILQREGNNMSDSKEAVNKKADTDWQYESARMHLVYGNAFVTFVAAAASHSDEGLVLHNSHNRYSGSFLHTQPISGRAWTLQEWALSSRLLVFSNSNINFVCDHFGRFAQGIRIKKITLLPYPSGNLFGGWHKLVSDYCSRDLTVPQDKLTAVSGLAQTYARILKLSGKDYLAGLWRHRLPDDLLWRRQPCCARLNVPNNIGRQPGRAPTWSWASIDGNVEVQAATRCPRVKIKNCQVELAVGDDVFGQVKSGILEISCLYTTAWFFPWDRTYNIWAVGGLTLIPDDVSEFEKLLLTPELHCLQLGLCEIVAVTYGIAVQFDEKKLVFVRVGSFWCDTKDCCISGQKDFKIG